MCVGGRWDWTRPLGYSLESIRLSVIPIPEYASIYPHHRNRALRGNTPTSAIAQLTLAVSAKVLSGPATAIQITAVTPLPAARRVAVLITAVPIGGVDLVSRAESIVADADRAVVPT